MHEIPLSASPGASSTRQIWEASFVSDLEGFHGQRIGVKEAGNQVRHCQGTGYKMQNGVGLVSPRLGLKMVL